MFAPVDTRVPQQVEEQVRSIYRTLFPDAAPNFVQRAFAWASQCFTGHFADYQPIDARYHDFEHTLQGTLCLARLLQGYHKAGATPQLTRHAFELALLAILFHDTGYLKRRSDTEGTGAKYTLVHVARSADFAREFLLQQGYATEEIDAIRHMIRCTGVNADLDAIPFRNQIERNLGYALATADLLGQMAAPDYIDKLPVLFQEFAEAVRHDGPNAGRISTFRSAEALMQNTPSFWENYVVPKITHDFENIVLYLSDPYPDGPNDYLRRIEQNLALIPQKLAALRAP